MDSYSIESIKKKSRIPARLDFLQSGTGLILGLFMWAHMFLVGSIILGKGSFNFVAKTMELAFLSDTGHGFPIAVFFAVLTIFTLFIEPSRIGWLLARSWTRFPAIRHGLIAIMKRRSVLRSTWASIKNRRWKTFSAKESTLLCM